MFSDLSVFTDWTFLVQSCGWIAVCNPAQETLQPATTSLLFFQYINKATQNSLKQTFLLAPFICSGTGLSRLRPVEDKLLFMAERGADIKDPVCLQELSWMSQNGVWLYVLHMGVCVSFSQLVSDRASLQCRSDWLGDFPFLLMTRAAATLLGQVLCNFAFKKVLQGALQCCTASCILRPSTHVKEKNNRGVILPYMSIWHYKITNICFLACLHQLEGVDTGDFEAINAAAFLLSTETSKTIFIAVKDDDLPEADETFTFNLTLQVKSPLFVYRFV